MDTLILWAVVAVGVALVLMLVALVAAMASDWVLRLSAPREPARLSPLSPSSLNGRDRRAA